MRTSNSSIKPIKKLFCSVMATLLCCVGFVSSVWAVAAVQENVPLQKKLCVYDPLGATGPLFQNMKDYRINALSWGVDFSLSPYTNERVAAEDFKSGVCDAVLLTGLRGRHFNSFTGTLDSIGAMPSYEHLKAAFTMLASEKAAVYMREGPFEVVGLLPGGAAYLYVKDKGINSPSKLSGKRFAVLDTDPAQKQLVMSLGAAPVTSDIASMYSQFNNGAIDIVFGPAVVYQAMELEKGLRPNGGVIRFPLGQLTVQMVVRHESFSEAFCQKSREYALDQFDRTLELIQTSEQAIDQDLWVDIPDQAHREYVELLRQARLSLRDQGIYDGKMLGFMSKVRCKYEPTRPECTAQDRE